MRRLRRRGRSLATGVALGLGILAVTPIQAATPRVTITFMHWGTQEYADRYRAIIEAFEKENPDIHVEQLHTPDGYGTKLATMFAAGTPPDTFILDMQETAFYGKNGQVVNLLPLAQQDASYRLHELNRVALDIMAYKGQVLGLPTDAGPNFYFFNKQMFDEAGLEIPWDLYRHDAWTWRAFQDAARKLTRRTADGKVQVLGASVVTGGALHRLWMWSNGAAEYDDYKAPTRNLYDAPEAIQALQFLQQLMHQDRTVIYPGNNPLGQDETNSFAAARLAMMARWSTGIPRYRDVPFTFGVVPYPKGPATGGRYAADMATSGYAIAKGTKNLAAAWRWVAYATGPKGARWVGRQGPGLPLRPGVPVEFLPKALVNPEAMAEILMLPNQGNMVRLLSVDQAQINRMIDTELRKIYSGQEAPGPRMQEIAKMVNEFLRQNPQNL